MSAETVSASGQAASGAPGKARAAGAKPRRALLVVNKNSRQGAQAAGPAIERLGSAGYDLMIGTPESAREVTPWILAHAEGADAVIVAGGDGTLNAAAPALVETGLPLGILPVGTANDLARTLGLPVTVQEAAAVIAAGRVRRIDIGDVNGHLFFNVASLGLSADLARTLDGTTKRRFGRFGYFTAAMRVLARARPFRATIVTPEGEARVKTMQIAVGNGRYYGGGMAVEQSAAIDDAELDLYSLELRRVWKLVLMAKAFRDGRHGLWQEVRAVRGSSFEIRTRRPRPINTDGELVTFTPARFSVLPGAVSVFAPGD